MRRQFFFTFCFFFLLHPSLEARYRYDSNVHSHLAVGHGGRKSYIDQKTGNLVPADVQGNITPLDHIARSRNRRIKSRSQYTSFSTLDNLDVYYGDGYRITLDVDRLQSDISARRILGIKIYTTEALTRMFREEMVTVLKLTKKSNRLTKAFENDLESLLTSYYAMVRIKRAAQTECDTYFWANIASLRKKYPSIFSSLLSKDYEQYTYTVNGLRHVRTDHELLVEGEIPARYLTVQRAPGP